MIFQRVSRNFDRVVLLLRVYYILLLAIVQTEGLGKLNSVIAKIKPRYLFPLELFQGVNHLYLSAASAALLTAACGAAALRPHDRFARMAVTLLFFGFNALVNSTGGLTHLYAFWLWTSVCFALLPSIPRPRQHEPPRTLKMTYLAGWWGAQAVVLLFYGLSGFWKLVGALKQAFNGEPNFLSQAGLQYHLASEILRTGTSPVLKDFLFEHAGFNPWLALAALLLQLACFPAIFLDRYKPCIGVSLLLFHLGTFLFLGISYDTNVFLLGVLLIVGALSFETGAPVTRGRISCLEIESRNRKSVPSNK